MLECIIQQLTPREFPHVIQGMFQPLSIELYIKYNCMEMSGHHDISIDPQAFVLYTEIQTFSDYFAGGFINEYR